MDNAIVDFFQSFRSDFLDNFFLFITQFGDKYFLFLVILLLYWCVGKQEIIRLIFSYLIGQIFVQVLKNTVKRTRPFDNNHVSIGEKTSGYSFPSGHSYSITAITTLTAPHNKLGLRKIFTLGLIVLSVLVMISRMYLGQHYFTDVIMGAIIGTTFIYLLDKLSQKLVKFDKLILSAIAVLLVVGLFFIKKESFYQLSGLGVAFIIGYLAELRFVKYQPLTARKMIQAFKIFFGLSSVILMFVLYHALIVNSLISTLVFFFLIGLWSTIGLMSIFKRL